MNLQEFRQALQETLADNGIETPGNVSLLLLGKILDQSKTWILTHGEYNLTPSEHNALQTSLETLLQGFPLPYILGEWEFYGRKFILNPNVLIPRPETELLIEQALDAVTDRDHPAIVDVGCGTGIIAITLAAELPQARLVAVDLSRPALHVSQRNAVLHKTQIKLLQADLLQPLSGPFDLICANLPYIPSDSLLELDVNHWEPSLALDGGPTGLSSIERLLVQAQTRLVPGGVILLEIEASLGEAVMKSAGEVFPNAKTHLIQDLAGKDRVVKIQIR